MKSKEIEKKFLTSSDDWKFDVEDSFMIYQSYYQNGDIGTRIRVVPQLNKAVICVKTPISSSSNSSFLERNEDEEEIDLLSGLNILLKCNNMIVKKRHLVGFFDFKLEIDVFKNLDTPLTMVEIEVKKNQIQELRRMILPAWVGEEVTKDPSFENFNLIKRSHVKSADLSYLNQLRNNLLKKSSLFPK